MNTLKPLSNGAIFIGETSDNEWIYFEAGEQSKKYFYFVSLGSAGIYSYFIDTNDVSKEIPLVVTWDTISSLIERRQQYLERF